MKKLICILLGHDDPVMNGLGIISEKELYERWKSQDRKCKRCEKQMHTSPSPRREENKNK